MRAKWGREGCAMKDRARNHEVKDESGGRTRERKGDSRHSRSRLEATDSLKWGEVSQDRIVKQTLQERGQAEKKETKGEGHNEQHKVEAEPTKEPAKKIKPRRAGTYEL